MAEMIDLLEAGDALARWLDERAHPRYRADQIHQWVFQKRANSWDAMTNLPKPLRAELAAAFRIWSTCVAEHRVARDGTEKLLLELAHGGRIECVLLAGAERRSICVSTQVGCAMGCVFCASGLLGVDRNLTSGEIIEQALQLQRLLSPAERLSHLVVMGMGEPLANLDQLLPALDEIHREDRLGISARRITISTVGIPAAIRRLAQRDAHYHLAISLHAANDTLRNRLVPVNTKVGLHDLMHAADEYFEASGRRLTYEYVLLANVNDQPEHALQLVKLLRGRSALLNVIPYNPVEGLPYASPTPAAIQRFRDLLLDGGVHVQFRIRKGDDIDAACGQLRRSRQTR